MNIVKNIRKGLFRIFKEEEAKVHTLRYLFWECTLRCNLSCIHCGSDCKRDAEVPDMPLPNFLRVLDEINSQPHELITVVITGGEPLMRNDLELCGKEIRKRGFRWSIVTNGLLYSQERQQALLNAGMGALTLSFDGLYHTHTWLRSHKASWEAALHAMQLAVRVPRIAFDVVTCVNKKNFSELEAIYNILLENGVKAWRLFTIAPIGRAKGNEDLHLSGQELHMLMHFIADKKRIGNMNVNFSCEGYVSEYEENVRDGFFFCRAGIHIGSVLVNGDIAACPNIDHNFAQGNIYHDHFMDVWNNKYETFRNRKLLKTGICEHCKEFSFCQGNGMHLREAGNPDVLHCHHQLLNQS